MDTIIWVLVIAVVIVGGLVYLANRETGADVDQDGDVDLQDAKLAAQKTVKEVKTVAKETKRRAKRVAEETADVVKAVKEVGNQTGDIVKAAKGKPRTGRKPKAKAKK